LTTSSVRPVPVDLLPHLRRARDHIDRHFAEPFDVSQLASIAGVSRHHFVRSFHTVYGDPPMQYAARRRVERAQDLLRSANLTVTEVCMVVGYSSLGSFSSRFRELTGESPLQYRDRFARDGAPRIPGCFLFMRGVTVLDHRNGTDGGRSSNPGEASARPRP
jgi:transcriptional regulator GlxA family with amidase domain